MKSQQASEYRPGRSLMDLFRSAQEYTGLSSMVLVDAVTTWRRIALFGFAALAVLSVLWSVHAYRKAEEPPPAPFVILLNSITGSTLPLGQFTIKDPLPQAYYESEIQKYLTAWYTYSKNQVRTDYWICLTRTPNDPATREKAKVYFEAKWKKFAESSSETEFPEVDPDLFVFTRVGDEHDKVFQVQFAVLEGGTKTDYVVRIAYDVKGPQPGTRPIDVRARGENPFGFQVISQTVSSKVTSSNFKPKQGGESPK